MATETKLKPVFLDCDPVYGRESLAEQYAECIESISVEPDYLDMVESTERLLEVTL